MLLREREVTSTSRASAQQVRVLRDSLFHIRVQVWLVADALAVRPSLVSKAAVQHLLHLRHGQQRGGHCVRGCLAPRNSLRMTLSLPPLPRTWAYTYGASTPSTKLRRKAGMKGMWGSRCSSRLPSVRGVPSGAAGSGLRLVAGTRGGAPGAAGVRGGGWPCRRPCDRPDVRPAPAPSPCSQAATHRSFRQDPGRKLTVLRRPHSLGSGLWPSGRRSGAQSWIATSRHCSSSARSKPRQCSSACMGLRRGWATAEGCRTLGTCCRLRLPLHPCAAQCSPVQALHLLSH